MPSPCAPSCWGGVARRSRPAAGTFCTPVPVATFCRWHALSIPISAQTVVRRVCHCGIEGRHIPMGFGPTITNLVAQTDVDGKIRTNFIVVLDEYLRTLQAAAILG